MKENIMKKTILFALISVILSSGCRWGKIPDYNEFTTVFTQDRTELYFDDKRWDFADFLKEEISNHPEMECVDLYKFCRQAAFGIHSADPEVRKKFFADFNNAPEKSKNKLIRVTSPDTARVDIAAWKKAGLPAQWLFNMSIAESEFKDAASRFEEYLKIAAETVAQSNLTFSEQEFRDFAASLKNSPQKPMPHSDIYRQNSAPYRIISTRYFNTIPILKHAAKLPRSSTPRIIAIDGRSASGKTTAAKQLKMILNAQIIHMDDFFLPPPMRTKMRYEQPGGNIHLERFKEEILPFLRKKGAFSYRVFDCKKNAFDGNRMIWENSPWRIVEGAYSQHPQFGDYADIKIFFDISKEEQMRRIYNRNGAQAARIFQTKWIPLEENYIRTFRIDRKADLILR